MKAVMIEANGKNITIDGTAVELYCGSVQYFRIHPEQWADRLMKLKACGFNAVETYLAWNLHEPEKGNFNFSGIGDFERFLSIAQDLGLYAVVRPGPYICAEWDAGGLPAWLLAEDCAIRTSDEKYLTHVRDYFAVILPKIRNHLYSRGGNVIALQIENEYGSYGNDKNYLRFLKNLYEEFDMDCLWFTSDGVIPMMLSGGSLPEVFKTVNFGSDTTNSFRELDRIQRGRPRMCAEFWCGWFDWWGGPHHMREAESVSGEIETMLDSDVSFNLYMFCGGTNFGFTSGANCDNKRYMPTVTSYDYCAPVGESGDYSPVYFLLRDLLHRKRGIDAGTLPPAPVRQNIGEVVFTGFASLFDNLDKVGKIHTSVLPRPMETYGQSSGYILYRIHVSGHYEDTRLSIRDVRDVAYVYVDGVKTAAFSRMDYSPFSEKFDRDFVPFPEFEGEKRIDVLVEALGRVNYGEYMPDLKGIAGVYVNRQQLTGFEIYTLPLDDLGGIEFTSEEKECPVFLKGHFPAQPGVDCFVDFAGFTKGCIFINGFNLGRYWNIGPQKALYVPGPVLKEDNEIVVFELEGYANPRIRITDAVREE